jgi:hypothetical protein
VTTAVIISATRAGARLAVRDGRIVARPVGALPTELREQIAAHETALVVTLSDPRKAAAVEWRRAMREVADAWAGHAFAMRAAGRQPHWVDDEAQTAIVGERISSVSDSASLGAALEAMVAWRRLWQILMDAPPYLARPRSGSDELARALVEESLALRPPPNAGVHRSIEKFRMSAASGTSRAGSIQTCHRGCA